jgi:hypothetical protein
MHGLTVVRCCVDEVAFNTQLLNHTNSEKWAHHDQTQQLTVISKLRPIYHKDRRDR